MIACCSADCCAVCCHYCPRATIATATAAELPFAGEANYLANRLSLPALRPDPRRRRHLAYTRSLSYVPSSPLPVTFRVTCEPFSTYHPLPSHASGAVILGRHCFSARTFPVQHIPALPCSTHRLGDTPATRVELRSNGHSRRLAYITSVLTPARGLPSHSSYAFFETCISPPSVRGAERMK